MWALIFSLCSCISLVMSLVFCLCWRKKTPNNELLGLDGMVTQKNPDENVNHLPPTAPYAADGMNFVSGDCVDANKSKSTTASNTRRSLPDIPSDQIVTVNWEPTIDNSSEHYATVGQYHNNLKRHTLPNGIEPRSSISQHSSLSQADDSFSPYERVKYDKITSTEHPYAQVQPSTSRVPFFEENQTIEEHTSLLRIDGLSINDVAAPSRSRRSSDQSSLEIPAATAVAGGVAASPELPYMTPPVAQPNFSGDSQDSSKGYTSITVREPLANIIAQTKEMNKRRELDPHYATVSDDSDDVYTTIPDPNNQIYTSESETYARIPAVPITVEVEVNPVPVTSRLDDNTDETIDDLYEAAPPPHSASNLKHISDQSHSRQASSSSSVANLSSPKPEKRQANSPLPPPPTIPLDPNSDKLQVVKNLDELYAKVHKNKHKGGSDDEHSPDKVKPLVDRNSAPNNFSYTESHKYHEPEKIRKEHNYETLRKSPRKSTDPGYECIKNDKAGYTSINGPDALSNSEPGYEVLKQQVTETDPNYEELQDRVSTSDFTGYSKIKDNSCTDVYSVVNKLCKNDDKSRTSSSFTSNSQELSLDEPNYESMPSESNSDPNYSVLKSTGSESDPNYESVKYLDEPPYERLDNDSSKIDINLANYEKIQNKRYEDVDTSESSNGKSKASDAKFDPPYEHLKSDAENELPGYEKIKFDTRHSESASNDSLSSSAKHDSEPNYSTIKDEPAINPNDKLFTV